MAILVFKLCSWWVGAQKELRKKEKDGNEIMQTKRKMNHRWSQQREGVFQDGNV